MQYKPHDYQQYAINYILEHPIAAVILGMGLGKTGITLTAIEQLMYDSLEVSKVLVVASLRVAWKRIRDKYASKHPFCEKCYERGVLVSVEEIHHKKPLSKGGTHDWSNLIALCKSCHSQIHAKRGDRWGKGSLEAYFVVRGRAAE